ncbi:MAG: hypothetical protein KC613_11845 [Myxococcales bacterium]|nr:hypothetical protein [Myxococcales bacterium]
MASKKSNRSKSKAAQVTHATRDDRQREKALDAVVTHPDAVEFESRGTVDDALYQRHLEGPSAAEQRKMWRNLIFLAIALIVPSVFFIMRVS